MSTKTLKYSKYSLRPISSTQKFIFSTFSNFFLLQAIFRCKYSITVAQTRDLAYINLANLVPHQTVSGSNFPESWERNLTKRIVYGDTLGYHRVVVFNSNTLLTESHVMQFTEESVTANSLFLENNTTSSAKL